MPAFLRLVPVIAIAVASCGPKDAAAPIDYGPPRELAPIDPIACPAGALERFAARVGAPLAITTEPVVDAARTDRVPCKPDETDDACLARARRRPTPTSYEVAGVTVGGEVTHVDFTYQRDGRIVSEQAASPAAMVDRLKALQAAGHKIVVLNYAAAEDAMARHAAITYRGVGGRQRRIATLRWHPTPADRAMAETQAAAARERMEIRSMHRADDGELVVVATCGPGHGPS